MREKKIIGITLTIIGLILIFGISVWLGFSCPEYDRLAIAIVSYIVGFVMALVGLMLLCGGGY